jgi:hypothetical protein
MMLLDAFDEVLTVVEDAISRDASFASLASALHNFVVLHTYRDAVATHGRERLLSTIVTLFNKAVAVLPNIAGASDYDEVQSLLGHLQTLVRVALTFDAVVLDRDLLVGGIHELVARDDGAAVIRGAGFGVLFSFGATREKVVARELDSYLMGSTEKVLQAGEFLDGLFMSSKNIFMGNPRLIRAINNVIKDLDWEVFKTLLPDLRRAFTQFIPSEIDDISLLVSEEIGLDEAPPVDAPIPEALFAAGRATDTKIAGLLQEWL